MTIAIIGSKGIPCRSGGVEKHVEELAKRFVKRGHKVLVYARLGYTKKRLQKYKGIKIIYPPYIPTKNLAAITHTFFSLLHILFKKVDIIHIHSVGPSLLALIPRIFKRGAKTIVTFHSRDYFNQKWSKFARFFLILGEWTAISLPHTTIIVSQTLYRHIRKEYLNKNLVYIPNGASLERPLKPQRIKKWGLRENNYLLIVCRLIPLKGIHYVIQAFKSLNINKKLVIVGTAGQENKSYTIYLKYITRNNPQVVFTGEQQGKVLSELFSNAYLYILPSEVEGLSISLLEALSFGRCALVSDIKENQEAIGEVGYTFKSHDVSDLTRKLEFLNDHPELVFKTERSSRERIRKYYNWNEIADKTIKLYQTMLEAKAKSKISQEYKRKLRTAPAMPACHCEARAGRRARRNGRGILRRGYAD